MGSTADAANAPAGDLARFALVGGGAVGRLFAAALTAAGREVTVVLDAAPQPHAELRALGVAYVALDVREPSGALRDALTGADCALLALPETAALEALPRVLAALPAGALLADTLSVKTPYAQAALAAAAPVELLSLNPMFAPSLGFAGHAVAAIELAPGPRSRALLALLGEWCEVVVLPDATAHDRLAAVLQALPHAALLALGGALGELDAELDALLALAPPPFLTLLALLARIASGAPATYADVQRANPHAAAARAALADALARLDAAAGDADPRRAEALVAQAGAPLGAHRGALAAQAAALLAQVAPPAR